MSNPLFSSYLPDLRRIVTAHDERGLAIVESDSVLPSQAMDIVKGARSAAIWVTTDSIPTNDNNSNEDGGARKIDEPTNLGLVHPNGTNLRSTDLAPGAITPMVAGLSIEIELFADPQALQHRTSSLDYNILVQGELVLIAEDGTEKHLRNPGDTVIQKGTMHAWRNPSTKWARWVTVLIAAEPAIIKGELLKPEFVLKA